MPHNYVYSVENISGSEITISTHTIAAGEVATIYGDDTFFADGAIYTHLNAESLEFKDRKGVVFPDPWRAFNDMTNDPYSEIEDISLGEVVVDTITASNGIVASSFTGTFSGDGSNLTNLPASESSNDYVSLTGVVYGASFQGAHHFKLENRTQTIVDAYPDEPHFKCVIIPSGAQNAGLYGISATTSSKLILHDNILKWYGNGVNIGNLSLLVIQDEPNTVEIYFKTGAFKLILNGTPTEWTDLTYSYATWDDYWVGNQRAENYFLNNCIITSFSDSNESWDLTSKDTTGSLGTIPTIIGNEDDLWVVVSGTVEGDVVVNGSIEATTAKFDSITITTPRPTSNAGLVAGQEFTQTGAELGGSGTTKVVCVV